jgi:hypothetical protein
MPAVTGRPRIIDSPEHFDQLVDQYVTDCFEEKEPLTITGMALYLGFAGKSPMYNYATREARFSDSVKRASALVEHAYEVGLAKGAGAGHIFALKNFNWTDRQEITGQGGGPIETKSAVVDAKALSDVADKL